MKNKIMNTICIIISLGYILFGLLIWDWSFRMVPFNSSSPKSSIISTTILCCFYGIFGVLLCLGVGFAVMKKNIGVSIITFAFWGASVVLLIGCGVAGILIVVGKMPQYFFGDILFYIAIFMPSLYVYLKRKLIGKN